MTGNGVPGGPFRSAVHAVLSERTLALVLVVLTVLVLAPPPSPVHVSYVTSGSMQPALESNDGYVIVSGTTIESGDIVTYRAPDADEYVTHRVVGVTDEGFITKGDANPSTDQAAGAPPVDRSAVLGTVLTVNDQPLVVPELGTAAQVLSTQRGRLAALAVVGLWLLARSGTPALPERSVTHVREVAVPVIAVLAVGGLFTLAYAGTTQTVSYQVVEDGSESNDVLVVGKSTEREISAQIYRPPLTTVVTNTEGMAVTDQTVDGSTITVSGSVPPPSQPGQHDVVLEVQPYPSTLPQEWLELLHRIHPIVAMVVSSGTAFVLPVSLYVSLFDGWTPIRRPNWRWLHRLGGDSR